MRILKEPPFSPFLGGHLKSPPYEGGAGGGSLRKNALNLTPKEG